MRKARELLPPPSDGAHSGGVAPFQGNHLSCPAPGREQPGVDGRLLAS
jgi:hypothetical protein